MSDTTGTRSLRALEIIEYVARASHPVAVSDITAGLDLPRPTAHRLISLLLDEGYLQRDPVSRRLISGARVMSFALLALTRPDVRGARRAVLQDVADRTHETVNLSMPDGDRMIYVDRVETDWPLRLQYAIGSRVPLHCTAGGKLYLSQMPDETRNTLIHSLPLKRHTAATITDPVALRAAVAKIAQTELGTDSEELLQGMSAIAAPVRDSDGRMLASLAVQAPVARFTLADLKQFEDLLRDAAEKLGGIMAPDSAEESSLQAG